MTTGPARNRLRDETSPYLLQHSSNPVDWYPWGPEALERARREDRPILLSIGYAACHWCHVMERESFENEAIAALMNESFVCIKVDREERPDLDEIYMAATVASSGSGGWPMTVFLTPEQKPFFAGTYFPAEDRYGRPGFGSLLERIAEMWKGERDNLLSQAEELTEHVQGGAKLARPGAVGADAIDKAVEDLRTGFDPRFGGFGGAPKFPPCASLSLLCRQYQRTRDPKLIEMVKTTLDCMKNGGIYDQIAGGFARYSTDERWLVPHFEKMLYDNAGLARVYLEAHQLGGDPEYRRIASETLDYVIREMQSPDGGYYSATDADSEGVEGKYFVWTQGELRELLGEPDAERVARFYNVTEQGNFEGKNILWTPKPLAHVARALGIGPEELGESVDRSKRALYAARQERVPPLLDDKVLTGWNALMLSSMAEGFRVLRDRRYLESAERAAGFLLETMTRPDGGLYRAFRAGKAHLDGYLEDYAYLGDALLDLYEAGGSPEHLANATRLAERMLADFGDGEGGAFFFTAHGHETLIARSREGHDGPIPNANAVAARLLARLSVHLDRPEWRARAEAAITAYGQGIARVPRAFATTLSLSDFLLQPPTELVLAGEGDGLEALARELGRHYLPNRVAAVASERAESPLTRGKTAVDGKAALYVCRDYTCRAPITDPAEVASALGADLADASRARNPSVGRRRLAGCASREGTLAYAQKLGANWGTTGYVELGGTDLWVSRLGFGGYRVAAEVGEHRAALEKALQGGVNLIDTSTNYTDGDSERLVADVLGDLAARGVVARDQVVIVSKLGYVQGKNLEIAEAREREGKPFPEMVKVGEGIWHCLHPEWLDDQLTRSLDRLGLETLDVCLLHNPEYFFGDAVKRGLGPLSELRDEFYRRVEAAFAHFEREIVRGRIKSYGVSSNSFVSPADDREATELTRVLAAARAAGGESNHFCVVELPMNLGEAGAALEKNNGARSVLEVAREAGLGVLVNRPLNVIAGPGLIRLADPPRYAGAEPFDEALATVRELEARFRQTFAGNLSTGPGGPPADTLFAWGEQLAKLPAAAETLAQWSDLESQVVWPRTRQVMVAVDRAMRGEARERWEDWVGKYLAALERLLLSQRARAAEVSRRTSARLHAALDPFLPGERRKESLSRKALAPLISTPGVSSVLVGMRRAEYVDDACGVLGWAPLERPEALLRAVSKTLHTA
jgi:uncharacterized protein